MSGKFSRDKGARGERLAAAELERVTGVSCTRAARNGVSGAADVLGLDPYVIEVKFNYITPNLNGWWSQALRQAESDSDVALLIYKLSRKPWVIRVPGYMLSSSLIGTPGSWIEMPPDTFGVLYREGAI